MTTTTTQLLSDESIEQFRRDGFVVIPGLLTEEELDRYEAAVTAGVEHRAGGDTRPVEERSRYQQMFIQCMNLWEDCPDVAPLTFNRKLGQAAAELLGVARGAAVARPGAVQAARWTADRRTPGSPVLADERVRLRHRMDRIRRFQARRRRDGLPARLAPHRHAQVHQHLRRARGHLHHPRGGGDRTAMGRGAPGVGGVPPRVDDPHGRRQRHGQAPCGAHDHLLQGRQHAQLAVGPLRRRTGQDPHRCSHRQRRDADRLAARHRRRAAGAPRARSSCAARTRTPDRCRRSRD